MFGVLKRPNSKETNTPKASKEPKRQNTETKGEPKNFLELLGLTNCILPNIIMSHALGTKRMGPINSTLVVIINRNRTHWT